MSVTELNRLKTTLEEIDSIRRRIIPKMSEKISELEGNKANQLKEISSREKSLEKSLTIKKEHDEWGTDAQKKIKHNDKFLEKARAKLTDFESEVLPEIEEQSSKIDQLMSVQHGFTITILSGMLLSLLLVIGAAQGYAEARDLPRGEWVCDNGEIIDLLDVMDNTDHCSDGSDEEFYVFSDSRAEEAEESEEYSKLMDAKWSKWWDVTLQVIWPGIISFVFGCIYWTFENKFNQDKIQVLHKDNKKLKDKHKSLRKNVKSWENKNASVEGSISSRREKIASIQNQKTQVDAALEELNLISIQIERAETERAKYVEKETELWESIRDIIPLGDATTDIL